MAGSTSPLAFPYPTGTDRVMDGDNAIQALAERLNAYLNTTYAVVGLDANVGALSSNNVRKTGGMVTIWLALQNNVAYQPSWGLATVPAGFRPVQDTQVQLANPDTGVTNTFAWVTTAGVVMPGGPWAIHTKVVGSITYPVPPGT